MSSEKQAERWEVIRHEINNAPTPDDEGRYWEGSDDPRWPQLGVAAKRIATLEQENERLREFAAFARCTIKSGEPWAETCEAMFEKSYREAQEGNMKNQYRKKPVVIEAFQMTESRRVGNSEWPNWMHKAWNEEREAEGSLYPTEEGTGDGTLSIGTLEGQHLVSWDDWIIQGVAGEIYPCKPAIFEATYEAVR